MEITAAQAAALGQAQAAQERQAHQDKALMADQQTALLNTLLPQVAVLVVQAEEIAVSLALVKVAEVCIATLLELAHIMAVAVVAVRILTSVPLETAGKAVVEGLT
jgi:hypothetical protein